MKVVGYEQSSDIKIEDMDTKGDGRQGKEIPYFRISLTNNNTCLFLMHISHMQVMLFCKCLFMFEVFCNNLKLFLNYKLSTFQVKASVNIIREST